MVVRNLYREMNQLNLRFNFSAFILAEITKSVFHCLKLVSVSILKTLNVGFRLKNNKDLLQTNIYSFQIVNGYKSTIETVFFPVAYLSLSEELINV
jgi:hypothetical protein